MLFGCNEVVQISGTSEWSCDRICWHRAVIVRKNVTHRFGLPCECDAHPMRTRPMAAFRQKKPSACSIFHQLLQISQFVETDALLVKQAVTGDIYSSWSLNLWCLDFRVEGANNNVAHAQRRRGLETEASFRGTLHQPISNIKSQLKIFFYCLLLVLWNDKKYTADLENWININI